MKHRHQHRFSTGEQIQFSLGAVLLLLLIGLFIQEAVGYRVVALVFLVGVSLLAMVLDRVPVVIAACLSALLWDYFFIPPHYTLVIGSIEDTLLLAMYFLVAMINMALTHRIRTTRQARHTSHAHHTLAATLSTELQQTVEVLVTSSQALQHLAAQQSADGNHIRAIANASGYLQRYVQNITILQQLNAATLPVKKDWCDLRTILDQVIHTLDSSLHPYQLVREIPADLPLMQLDAALMEMVLINLLQEAIHHTPAGTVITVQVIPNHPHVTLIIADNGVLDTHTPPTVGFLVATGLLAAQQGTLVRDTLPVRGSRITILLPTHDEKILAL